MDELQEKIARLPVWAREYIKRLQIAKEPLVEECVKARRDKEVFERQAKKYSAANEALIQLLRCAAKGGSDWARVVVSTLEDYEIYKSGEEPKE